MGAVNKANGRQSKKHENEYKVYRSEGRREKNKAARLLRSLKRQEARQATKGTGIDGQIAVALKKLSISAVLAGAKQAEYPEDKVKKMVK